MVSDEPLPDRCAAQCVNKRGVELTVEEEEDGEETGTDSNQETGTDSNAELVLTDEDVVLVRLADDRGDPNQVLEGTPDYESLRKFLWSDFEASAVALDPDADVTAYDLESHPGIASTSTERPPVGEDLADGVTSDTVDMSTVDSDVMDAIEDGEVTWTHVEPDTATNITNRYSEVRGYCEKYPLSDKERCLNHAGKSSGAPEGNTNAMTHGLKAQRTNYYQSLTQSDKEFVEAMVDSWLRDAPFERDHVAKVNELYRTAIDQHRAMNAVDEFVDEDGDVSGLTKEVTIDYDEEAGEEVTAEAEHPANLPYSRLDRDIISKLKELNVISSPESEQAEATQSLAKKLSGMTD